MCIVVDIESSTRSVVPFPGAHVDAISLPSVTVRGAWSPMSSSMDRAASSWIVVFSGTQASRHCTVLPSELPVTSSNNCTATNTLSFLVNRRPWSVQKDQRPNLQAAVFQVKNPTLSALPPPCTQITPADPPFRDIVAAAPVAKQTMFFHPSGPTRST